MANAFAYVMLFSWPLVMVVLFRILPLAQALCWTLILGYLLLPPGLAVNLPGVPALDKASITAVTAGIMCLFMAGRDSAQSPAPLFAAAPAAPPPLTPTATAAAGRASAQDPDMPPAPHAGTPHAGRTPGRAAAPADAPRGRTPLPPLGPLGSASIGPAPGPAPATPNGPPRLDPAGTGPAERQPAVAADGFLRPAGTGVPLAGAAAPLATHRRQPRSPAGLARPAARSPAAPGGASPRGPMPATGLIRADLAVPGAITTAAPPPPPPAAPQAQSPATSPAAAALRGPAAPTARSARLPLPGPGAARPPRNATSAPPQGPAAPARRSSADANLRPLAVALIGAPLLAILLGPILTVRNNAAPLVFDTVIVPGLTRWDMITLAGNGLIMLLPFLLAMRFLATPERHRILLVALALAAALYTLPALIEIRFSPQLNRIVYGYFPHSFVQHVRGGGFRPLVFLNHGLWLGIFLALGALAAAVLWRDALARRVPAGRWLALALWVALVLLLCRALGAAALVLLAAPVVLLASPRAQLLTAAALALVVLFYPMLRSADVVPVDRIVAAAERIDPERAASLAFRIRHEDALLAHAAAKPISGWGTFGRNRVRDEDTGRDLSVTDGAWIITLSTHGWVGYLGSFGLLTLPILVLALRRRGTVAPVTAGLALASGVTLMDLLPNATLTPVTWLVAGALAGAALRAPAPVPDPAARAPTGSPAAPLTARLPRGSRPLAGLPPSATATATATPAPRLTPDA